MRSESTLAILLGILCHIKWDKKWVRDIFRYPHTGIRSLCGHLLPWHSWVLFIFSCLNVLLILIQLGLVGSSVVCVFVCLLLFCKVYSEKERECRGEGRGRGRRISSRLCPVHWSQEISLELIVTLTETELGAQLTVTPRCPQSFVS